MIAGVTGQVASAIMENGMPDFCGSVKGADSNSNVGCRGCNPKIGLTQAPDLPGSPIVDSHRIRMAYTKKYGPTNRTIGIRSIALIAADECDAQPSSQTSISATTNANNDRHDRNRIDFTLALINFQDRCVAGLLFICITHGIDTITPIKAVIFPNTSIPT